MNYYVYVSDIMKDVSTVVDYLEVGSLHHVRSYFWWGGTEIEQLHRGGERNRKNSTKIIQLLFDNSISPKGPATVPVSGAYIPIFGACDSLSYTDTYTMHKEFFRFLSPLLCICSISIPPHQKYDLT